MARHWRPHTKTARTSLALNTKLARYFACAVGGLTAGASCVIKFPRWPGRRVFSAAALEHSEDAMTSLRLASSVILQYRVTE